MFHSWQRTWRRWLLQQQAEAEELQLQRRQIFILPTRTGLLYAIALVVMLLGAINYDLALGHALVFLLAGLGLVAMIHTFRNLLGLRLTSGAVAPVFAGERALLPVHLTSSSRTPRRALEISAGDTPLHTDLEQPGSTHLNIPLPLQTRGHHPLPALTISSCYPLGLFRAWAYYRPLRQHWVYPAPRHTPFPPARVDASDGLLQGTRGEEDFAGLRPRQPTDPLHHIAWKAAARESGNRPFPVKQFSGGATAQRWFQWQDLPPDMDIETKLSRLTGWILAAEAEHLRYGLALPGTHIPPGWGARHRQQCLETLALFPAS